VNARLRIVVAVVWLHIALAASAALLALVELALGAPLASASFVTLGAALILWTDAWLTRLGLK